MTIAADALVPFVGVVEQKGATAVQIAQALPRQTRSDVIHADRRALIAFAYLVGAKLALCHVIIGDETRRAGCESC